MTEIYPINALKSSLLYTLLHKQPKHCLNTSFLRKNFLFCFAFPQNKKKP